MALVSWVSLGDRRGLECRTSGTALEGVDWRASQDYPSSFGIPEHWPGSACCRILQQQAGEHARPFLCLLSPQISNIKQHVAVVSRTVTIGFQIHMTRTVQVVRMLSLRPASVSWTKTHDPARITSLLKASFAQAKASSMPPALQEEPSSLRFDSNSSKPLNPETCNALIVDEVSMLDLPLAAALLSAISPHSFFQLVLIGESWSLLHDSW